MFSTGSSEHSQLNSLAVAQLAAGTDTNIPAAFAMLYSVWRHQVLNLLIHTLGKAEPGLPQGTAAYKLTQSLSK